MHAPNNSRHDRSLTNNSQPQDYFQKVFEVFKKIYQSSEIMYLLLYIMYRTYNICCMY